MRRSCLLLPVLCVSLLLHGQNPRESVIETIAGSSDENVPGTEFSFGAVAGLAADSSGNIFFTLQPLNQVYRLGIDGRVSPYAGNGLRGQYRNGVLATESPLTSPANLAIDSAGNLYVAVERALVKVDAGTKMLSTVFTTPYRPAGSSVRIEGVNAMTFGPGGVLYICDTSTIKSYTFQSGGVALIAGNGSIGEIRTGALATSTPLNYPHAIAVGADGTVYFSTLETGVYRIDQKGELEAINIRLRTDNLKLNDNGNAHTIDLDRPLGSAHALALDGAGHLFLAIANRSQVLRINLNSGMGIVYAGTGRQGFNGDWIDAIRANVTLPTFLTIDSDGNLVVGEEYRVRRIHVSGRIIETIAGNGLPGSAVTGNAGDGRLWEPANVAVAPDGSIYITSSFSQRLVRLNPGGGLVTVAGGGDPFRFLDPGPALEISLNYPEGLWISEVGEVYLADNDNRIVRHLEGDRIENFATTPKNNAEYGVFLYYAGALVTDRGHFYLSDPNGNKVWRISRSDGSVEPYAGIEQKLVNPTGLAIDSAGNLYIADGALNDNEGRILRIDPGTRRTSTVLSHLHQPSGLAFQSSNALCFAESGANQVRCFNLASHSIRTIVGTGEAGFAGDGGPAECARLNRPSGISFDAAGRLYIADTGNQRVRRVQLSEQESSCKETRSAQR